MSVWFFLSQLWVLRIHTKCAMIGRWDVQDVWYGFGGKEGVYCSATYLDLGAVFFFSVRFCTIYCVDTSRFTSSSLYKYCGLICCLL
ncbi:hypothetical protein BDD12DRAFT_501590 [Trichophaea hybrida]|nr:hypothetical protein BDD12DRAFT_501590 [Trichophaea hybrida]